MIKKYETKAKELGLAIKNKNNKKRFKLLKWFWDKELMEIPEWISEESIMNTTCLEEKLGMLEWRTNIDLANTCFQLSLLAG